MHVDNRYWKPRDCLGLFLYWKICEYFKPKTIIELGFLEGLTFGLMFESTGPDTTYTCVDHTYKSKHVFDELFHDHPKYSAIDFVEIKTQDLELDKSFDLVHIDADHSYDCVKHDLEKVLPHLHKNSILIMDDFTNEFPGVSRAIEEYLLGQNSFVPFLAGDREMFFHHVTHDANDFLDNFLTKDSTNVMTFFNHDYKGFNITRGHVANFFNDNEQIFFDQLAKYNL
jgi:predicted O-methyltransferase YrrM